MPLSDFDRGITILKGRFQPMSDSTPTGRPDRRRFLSSFGAVAASGLLASCVTRIGPVDEMRERYFPPAPVPDIVKPDLASYKLMYGPVTDDGYEIPGIPIDKVDSRYYRQMVRYETNERPGTIIVDTNAHFLYLIGQNGQAMRYGVGLGRAGFAWSGRAVVQWKKKWPNWTPPDEMVARQPELAPYRIGTGGMQPGIRNPLGARALYIFQNGEDTLYRLHGNPEWRSIGKSVSSGCVRLMNQDIIDLYDRVPNGSPILVI